MRSQTLKKKANPPHFELRLGSSWWHVCGMGVAWAWLTVLLHMQLWQRSQDHWQF